MNNLHLNYKDSIQMKVCDVSIITDIIIIISLYLSDEYSDTSTSTVQSDDTTTSTAQSEDIDIMELNVEEGIFMLSMKST